MATSATLPLARITSQMVKNTAVGASADNHLTGSNATIYMLDITNNHGSAKGYFKIFDSANPTVGTTSPEIIIPIAGAQRQIVTIAEGITSTTGISWAFVNAAGTAGTGAITGGALAIVVVKAGA
jgi:hypothetical protein